MPAANSVFPLPNDESSAAKLPDRESINQAAILLAMRLYELGNLESDSGSPSTGGEVGIVGTTLRIRWELVQASGDDSVVADAAMLMHGPPAISAMQRRWKLTRTEARVAILLSERNTNREIASALGITEHTARRHTERVLKKLDVHNRAHVLPALLATPDWLGYPATVKPFR